MHDLNFILKRKIIMFKLLEHNTRHHGKLEQSPLIMVLKFLDVASLHKFLKITL